MGTLPLSIWTWVLIATLSLNAQEAQAILKHVTSVKHIELDGKIKTVTISRKIPKECLKIPFDSREFWGKNYASRDVVEECKATYIKTAGEISPMRLHKDIETFGELEVLSFIAKMKNDPSMIFVDSRKPDWFRRISIPSAVNIPYTYFTNPKYEKYRKKALRYFGVSLTQNGYDFSNAKTILFYCNGIWCGQSTKMIHALMELGYPAKKIKWYRGGLQSWTSVGLTTTQEL